MNARSAILAVLANHGYRLPTRRLSFEASRLAYLPASVITAEIAAMVHGRLLEHGEIEVLDGKALSTRVVETTSLTVAGVAHARGVAGGAARPRREQRR
ncbi:MAG: hypothetical protein HY898_22870 [Deltaproteobacteria bacterium]|nr:hypothetical protein [Deltaproteobacteria bacterium]